MAERDHGPTASLNTLRLRAGVLATIRRFFDSRGYWEVDTPILSADPVVDPHLQPFLTRYQSSERDSSGRVLALQTSPEFAMKRLLTAGADAIYQLGHVFRNGEIGERHNPEFTMVEWYRRGDTHLEQMDVAADLYHACAEEVNRHGRLVRPHALKSARRITYRDAFLRAGLPDPFTASDSELLDACRRSGAGFAADGLPPRRDDLLNLLLALHVEPGLGRDGPEFLFDYPASQAAIARIRPAEHPVAERFELYFDGLELCNGYHELTDPVEFRERIEAESRRRASEGLAPLPIQNRLLDAMQAGLPACSGVALGVDRVLMSLVGTVRIADVIPFPIDRA
jgi:lysyl-tRNA synthetase class 2